MGILINQLNYLSPENLWGSPDIETRKSKKLEHLEEQ